MTGYFDDNYKRYIDSETNILLLINLLWIMGWQYLYANQIDINNMNKFKTILSEF